MTAAISSFTVPAVPQVASAPATPPHHSGFAQMLSQRQAMAQPPAHGAAVPPGGPSAEEHAPSEPTAPASHPAARAAAHERQPAKGDKPNKAAPAKESEKSNEAADADKPPASEAADPALAEWMSALNLHTPPTPTDAPADKAATQGALPAGDESSAVAGKGPRHATGSRLADVAQQATAKQDGSEPGRAVADGHDKLDLRSAEKASAEKASTEKATGSQTDAAWQAVTERAATPAETSLRQDTPAVGSLGAAGHVAPASRPAEAAAPVAVALPTLATAPEFPQALGVQVSVLARDGVQQAELHLNPAEMGPISVQIALDGTQAQVNFGADSAATRQIIEGGLPELAAALRDAGFTLSGGGVHQQARGRGDGGNSGGGEGSSGRIGSAGELEAPARRTTVRVAAGGVDLYA